MCTLRKPFNRFTCHLAGTLAGSSDTFCYMGFVIFQGRGNLRVEPLNEKKLHLLTCDSPESSICQRFCLKLNYFGYLFKRDDGI